MVTKTPLIKRMIQLFSLVAWLIIFVLFFQGVYASEGSALQLTNVGSIRVAPGELLPVSLKLSNFGSERRVDVEVIYKIVNEANVVIHTEHETIAVETTFSSLKQLVVPTGTPPGVYHVFSSVSYPYQTTPATASFNFRVERSFLGIFQSDWLFYFSITLFLSMVSFFASRLFIRSWIGRTPLHSYLDKPANEQIYYEMISDAIAQMRLHAGDEALAIASGIAGLEIEKKTGKVVKILSDPAQIISRLVQQYESTLGQRVSFALRRG